jgi:3-oxoacyl-[acyl-carrier protein] reductase
VDLGLGGRVAIVTAASRGLGRASAIALAGEGARLVISARTADALDALAAELTAAGSDVLAVPGDVTDPKTPALLVHRALDRFGRLDVVVANSGGPPPTRALEVDDASVHAAIEANLLVHMRLARAALPTMRAAGWGRFCSIASSSVIQPIDTLALSNIARTGLRAWARTAAHELIGSGVTINLACPGTHATDRMKELGSLPEVVGNVDDFGRVVTFLCSAPASYISGTAILVDGGVAVAL